MSGRRRSITDRRGYVAVALDNVKSPPNVGGTLRAAACYGAELVVLSGPRVQRWIRHPTNTVKAWRHIPTQVVDDVFDALPFDCVPVAVEFVQEAMALPAFEHPERAFYVFGAEDNTLDERVLSRCRHLVSIPTTHSMNLAATVNVVLYDRLAKRTP